ncbi:MAG TPA: hypothetical protein VKS01_12010, partial [Bryobacteraceae bacterium]|nr:hypothetical protein [Bryobacteraceae bacterium]
PNGTLATTERIVTQEEKTYNGSNTHQTLYQSDVNGRMQEFERRSIEATTSGSSGTQQTEISRPDLSGSFQTVEKRSESIETTGGDKHTDETVYRRSDNGGFFAATREVSDSKQQGGKTTTTTAIYQPRDNQQLELTGQTVTSSTKRADGSSVSEVSYYGNTGGDGRAHERDSKLRLREEQTVELVPGPGGSLTQTVSASRPDISNPERMGPSRVVSQTTCVGTCSASNFGFMH